MRLRLENHRGVLASVMTRISEHDTIVIAVDMISATDAYVVRDITVQLNEGCSFSELVDAVAALPQVKLINASDRTFLMHLGGKIEVKSKVPITNRDELSMAYTPGVARVCIAIHEDPAKVYKLTIKKNSVAVVSDGTAVLGLGNLGPEAAMPVMEGKAMLFKDFAGIDAYPICLATTDVDEIVNIVKNIAPGFGGINLEDIAAPRCFEIEKRLIAALDIPVFHDDQHGTAIVMVAALVNALKLTGKERNNIKVVINGVGAAGVACKNMLLNFGINNIIGCDSKGIISRNRTDLNSSKVEFAATTNKDNIDGSVHDAIKGADVFIGLSAPDVLDVDDLKAMNKSPIVFAMANPDPEIKPEIAAKYVAVMATGRSDYPNQINNVLAFPGIFRGALDAHATKITQNMMLAAAHAIAGIIEPDQLGFDYIVPSVFDKRVAEAVSKAVKEQAIKDGVVRDQDSY
jgi:malate dehydrogenase (oxaloacetate-decarboxylating)